MSSAASAAPIELICHQCRHRYRIPKEITIKHLSKALCKECTAPFLFLQPGVPTAEQGTCEQGTSEPDLLVRRFSFHGRGGTLFGMYVTNAFLTLITCGIYYFWAKVNIRRYLLSQIEFEGDSFGYHGTGQELCFGFLKIVGLFGVPYAILNWGPKLVSLPVPVQVAATALGASLLAVFIPFTIVNARRYRFSRTSWRGVRFSFRGSRQVFVRLYLRGWFLTTVTLGAYYPFFDTKRQTFLASHSYLGNQRVRFEGSGSDLALAFLTAYLLVPFTLGLSLLWYTTKRQRYFWGQTRIAAARFDSTLTAPAFMRVKLANFFLLVFTLGMAWPWTAVRRDRLVLENLRLQGPIELEQIAQESFSDHGNEGLADWLDIGFDVG